jgi:hypothetical protein
LEKPIAFAIQDLDSTEDRIVWQYWGFGPHEIRRILIEDLGVREEDLYVESLTRGMTFSSKVAVYHSLLNSKQCWVVGSMVNPNYCCWIPDGFQISFMPCPNSQTNDILIALPTGNLELAKATMVYIKAHLTQLEYAPQIKLFNQARMLFTLKNVPITAQGVCDLKGHLKTLFNQGALSWTWPA